MTTAPNLDTSYPVLILKSSRRTIHHGALAGARSLGRLGVPVYAVVEDNYTPLALSRYLTKAFVWKSWPNEGPAFIEDLAAIAKAIDHPTLLIPIDDLSAIDVAEHSVTLSTWYLLPRLPPTLPRQLANKGRFYSLCTELGVPHPQTVIPHSLEEVRQFEANATYPLVAKALEQWHLIGDRYNAKIIRDRNALFDFCQQINFEEPPQMILQEYIPGEDWIYHAYCNADINLHLDFTGKKLLGYPAGSGATALGISNQNQELSLQMRNFLQAVSYSGIVDIDCRRDERDGQYKITDCNPRLGMNFRMFETSTGVDVVRAQHLDLTGRSVDCFGMIENRQFIVEPYCLLSCLRGGFGSLIEAIKDSAPASREYAWSCADDVIPVLMMSLRSSVQTIRGVLKQLWRSLTRASKRGHPRRSAAGQSL